MQEDVAATYRRYVDAFNAHDFDALEDFLASEVVFEWGGVMDDLVGRDAFFAFYREAWDHFDERIEARVVLTEGDGLRAWIDTELRVFRNWPDCPIRPFAAGDVVRVSGLMDYRFRNRQIVRIADADPPSEFESPTESQ